MATPSPIRIPPAGLGTTFHVQPNEQPMQRLELTKQRSMDSVAARVCRRFAWLLIFAVLSTSVGVGQGAQPEPALPAAPEPGVEGDDAAPPKADKPATVKPATGKPATVKPATVKPATVKPADAKAADATPPAAETPAAPAPAAPPATAKPATVKPGKAQPDNQQFEANLLRAAAAKRVAAANNAQAQQLAQQWRPTLLVELSFVRLLCPDLPPAKRVVVKAAGEQALLAAAEAATGAQRVANARRSPPQPMIRDALSETLREVLPADQWEHFSAESEARSKRRQAAIIRLVVEHIDEALYLTGQQRDQITQSLVGRWQPAWEGWLQLRYQRNLPVMPDDAVIPFLDADQKQAWQKIPKVQFGPNAVHVNMQNAAFDNDWWDEAAPAKPPGSDVPPP